MLLSQKWDHSNTDHDWTEVSVGRFNYAAVGDSDRSKRTDQYIDEEDRFDE